MSATATAQRIPFNRAPTAGEEVQNVREAIEAGHLAADGRFTELCGEWLRERIGCEGALLVHSCTGALEIAAALADLGPGDEVVMPSFTSVSTANPIALRGATPVFVDVRPDTLNLDESLVADAITPRTRAVVPVHYGGVACELDPIAALAEEHDLIVIEDAAQALMSAYRDRPLGGIGALGAISFHETKNVGCGHGGVLLVNDPALVADAEVVRHKGTDRAAFMRGEVDHYSWRSPGSSYAMSELNAAFLWAQLQAAEALTARRLELWERYHRAFEPLEGAGKLTRPSVPAGCRHNAHLYRLMLSDREERDALIAALSRRGIGAVFHYVPLHSSAAGRELGRISGELPVTEAAGERLVRLPLWPDLAEAQEEVIAAVCEFFGEPAAPA